jgi:hypothetical protein
MASPTKRSPVMGNNPKRGVPGAHRTAGGLNCSKQAPEIRRARPKTSNGRWERPNSGNARWERSQQSLLTKHRWSARDINSASPKILRERVEMLEFELNKLRSQRNLHLTGRSADTTRHGQKEIRITKPSVESSSHLPPLHLPSIRKKEPGSSGTKAVSVPCVSHVRSASSEQVTKPLRALCSKATVFTATDAKLSATHTVGTKLPQRNDEQPAPSEHAERPEASNKKDLPKYAGPSYAATVANGPVKFNEDPIKSVATVKRTALVLSNTDRHEARKTPLGYDTEWVNYLNLEFMFEPRTVETMKKMAGRLRKHVKTYDLKNYTIEDVYLGVARAVEIAMRVPVKEQQIRQAFKDPGAIAEMSKHNRFVDTGNAGVKGIMKNPMRNPFRNPFKEHVVPKGN